MLSARLWQKLGLAGQVTLQINSLGTAEDRDVYRAQLVEYLNDHATDLDEDSKRRLKTNPLRVLDTKNPAMSNIVAKAPSILECLSEESAEHFAQLQASLKECGQGFEINTRLVRGLDYYCHSVFEWVTNDLGAQGTVCAGGRYDGLAEQLGAKPAPGVGWALGMERILELVERKTDGTKAPQPEVYMILGSEAAVVSGLALAEQLREARPEWTVICNW